MRSKAKEYALYKGDTLLGIGTAAELANQLGVKKGTIKFYGTKTYRKRVSSKNGRVLVDLTED